MKECKQPRVGWCGSEGLHKLSCVFGAARPPSELLEIVGCKLGRDTWTEGATPSRVGLGEQGSGACAKIGEANAQPGVRLCRACGWQSREAGMQAFQVGLSGLGGWSSRELQGVLRSWPVQRREA
jgi:hypothetical protein